MCISCFSFVFLRFTRLRRTSRGLSGGLVRCLGVRSPSLGVLFGVPGGFSEGPGGSLGKSQKVENTVGSLGMSGGGFLGSLGVILFVWGDPT